MRRNLCTSGVAHIERIGDYAAIIVAGVAISTCVEGRYTIGGDVERDLIDPALAGVLSVVFGNLRARLDGG
jgi:hypothetical protein